MENAQNNDIVNSENNRIGPTQETIYRYSAYFYTLGVILIKTNKANMAKFYLLKAKDILEGFLANKYPLFGNIQNLLKVCDKMKKK